MSRSLLPLAFIILRILAARPMAGLLKLHLHLLVTVLLHPLEHRTERQDMEQIMVMVWTVVPILSLS